MLVKERNETLPTDQKELEFIEKIRQKKDAAESKINQIINEVWES